MKLFEQEIINISQIHTVHSEKIDNSKSKQILHFPANLTTYELIFFLSGESITTFNEKKLHDLQYSIRYLPKGIENGTYTVKTIIPAHCIDIFFDTPDEMPQSAINLNNLSELKPLFEKMYSVWNSKRYGYYSECMSILYEIIKKIKLHQQRYTTNKSLQKITPAYNYMIEHFCEHDFDYKKMCQTTNLSYNHFKELFIKHYHCSPIKYVTMLRIEKAKELIITNLYNITEISNMCGFENVYYFSTVFKKIVGVSPSKYNHSNLKNE